MQIHRHRAFTLLELLAVIGIIAVLVSILVPAIGSAWNHSRRVGSEVNLRSIGTIFDQYMDNERGRYPVSVPGMVYQTPRANIQSSLSHWESADQWSLLFQMEYPWDANRDMYLAPGANRDVSEQPVMTTVFSSYRYSATFLGHPKIWSGQSFSNEEWSRLIQGVRKGMVRFPSAKVLLWDVELPTIRRELRRDTFDNLNERSPMVFADGHAESRKPAEANEGVTNWARSATHPHSFLHNTRDGVYGRDY